MKKRLVLLIATAILTAGVLVGWWKVYRWYLHW